MEKIDAPAPLRHRRLLNAAVLAFVGLQVVLGVRSLALHDSRLGWGMFSYQTNYTVAYDWLMPDGSTRPQPALDVEGRALKYVGDDAAHRTRYGLGGIRAWMRSYARYMYAKYRPSDAAVFRAVVDYQINKHGARRSFVVQYPVSDEASS